MDNKVSYVFDIYIYLCEKESNMKNKSYLYGLLLYVFIFGLISPISIYAHQYDKEYISSDNARIVYMGRISREIPNIVRFTYPGVSIFANFEGTSLQMKMKPGSGSFMVEIDDELPFRILYSANDSILTLAEGLSEGVHYVRIMYIVEGYALKPAFQGFI